MKRSRTFCLVVLASVIHLCLASQSQAKDEAPYKDRVLGVFAPAGMDENGNLILEFQTVGQATQLGRFTSAGQLNVADDLTFTGINTLTAANGDQIFLDITEGRLTPTATPGIFVIELTTVFTGGTGRFNNVTGGFSGIGELNMDEGFFEGEGEGTISPPGKNKKK